MAKAGIGSRRHNERLIAEGRVRVNGKVVDLGARADLKSDVITVDGKEIKAEPLIYVKVYKPKGVLSSTEDELERGRTTVRDLIPVEGHIYPVGRLDKPSEGLMLLTNDGHLAHRLTHPRYGHEKTYVVALEGQMGNTDLARWRRGLELDGRQTAPAKIEVLNRQTDHTRLRITLREGRKRQIRRIAAAFDHPVTSLVRESIGPIGLGSLNPGEWSHLSELEVAQLQQSLSERPQPRRGYKRSGAGKKQGPRDQHEHRSN